MKHIEERVKGKEDTCDWNSKRKREGRRRKSNMRLIHNRRKHPGTDSRSPTEQK